MTAPGARITRYLVATDGKVHELSGSRHALVEMRFRPFMGQSFPTREEAIAHAEAYRVERVTEAKAALADAQAKLAHLEQLVFA